MKTKSYNEAIDDCIKIIEDGVMIDIDYWMKTKREFIKEVNNKLIERIKELKNE